ncbi:MAG: hypothetical protein K8T25_09295 [Planctomycetia bacterium]|nr:hypothetical protein [Planctomycetia bacterium]
MSQADAGVILACAMHSSFHARGISTDSECAESVLSLAMQCESEFAVNQCVAQFPAAIFEALRSLCEKLAVDGPDGFLEPFFIGGETAGNERRRRLDIAMARIRQSARQPAIHPDWAVSGMSELERHWLRVRHCRTVAGEPCKQPNCGADRVVHGVFCPRHHFEMLYGEAPPNGA